MKQSELAQLIEDYLSTVVDTKYFDVSLGVIADDILMIVQENGMKPPLNGFDPVLLQYTYGWENE